MKLERDLKKIEQLAMKRDDDDWEFRCFIKGSSLSVEKIDAVVHDMYRSVSDAIDCRQCANCCKEIKPVLNADDIKDLATFLAMSEEDFEAEYLERDEERGGLCFKVLPCPFLEDNLCAVYSHRPEDCRSYPHLHKDGFISRTAQAFSNRSVCPIVFNVYEGLKQRLWKRRHTLHNGRRR